MNCVLTYIPNTGMYKATITTLGVIVTTYATDRVTALMRALSDIGYK